MTTFSQSDFINGTLNRELAAAIDNEVTVEQFSDIKETKTETVALEYSSEFPLLGNPMKGVTKGIGHLLAPPPQEQKNHLSLSSRKSHTTKLKLLIICP